MLQETTGGLLANDDAQRQLSKEQRVFEGSPRGLGSPDPALSIMSHQPPYGYDDPYAQTPQYNTAQPPMAFPQAAPMNSTGPYQPHHQHRGSSIAFHPDTYPNAPPDRTHSLYSSDDPSSTELPHTGYQNYPSTEKVMTDEPYPPNPADEGFEANTMRPRPGRSGLDDRAKSWATMGPPPRSTGILRMWRKGERGKQWFRVRESDWAES